MIFLFPKSSCNGVNMLKSLIFRPKRLGLSNSEGLSFCHNASKFWKSDFWIVMWVTQLKKPSLSDHLVGGLKPSEKYEFVNWYDYSQLNGKNKIHIPNHPPVITIFIGLNFPFQVMEWLSLGTIPTSLSRRPTHRLHWPALRGQVILPSQQRIWNSFNSS